MFKETGVIFSIWEVQIVKEPTNGKVCGRSQNM